MCVYIFVWMCGCVCVDVRTRACLEVSAKVCVSERASVCVWESLHRTPTNIEFHIWHPPQITQYRKKKSNNPNPFFYPTAKLPPRHNFNYFSNTPICLYTRARTITSAQVFVLMQVNSNSDYKADLITTKWSPPPFPEHWQSDIKVTTVMDPNTSPLGLGFGFGCPVLINTDRKPFGFAAFCQA